MSKYLYYVNTWYVLKNFVFFVELERINPETALQPSSPFSFTFKFKKKFSWVFPLQVWDQKLHISPLLKHVSHFHCDVFDVFYASCDFCAAFDCWWQLDADAVADAAGATVSQDDATDEEWE